MQELYRVLAFLKASLSSSFSISRTPDVEDTVEGASFRNHMPLHPASTSKLIEVLARVHMWVFFQIPSTNRQEEVTSNMFVKEFRRVASDDVMAALGHIEALRKKNRDLLNKLRKQTEKLQQITFVLPYHEDGSQKSELSEVFTVGSDEGRGSLTERSGQQLSNVNVKASTSHNSGDWFPRGFENPPMRHHKPKPSDCSDLSSYSSLLQDTANSRRRGQSRSVRMRLPTSAPLSVSQETRESDGTLNTGLDAASNRHIPPLLGYDWFAGTFCYRINSRLFAVPLDAPATCPVCRMLKSEHPHTESEPALIRVSIPHSALLPVYEYKAHRRSSFDPSDSLTLFVRLVQRRAQHWLSDEKSGSEELLEKSTALNNTLVEQHFLLRIYITLYCPIDKTADFVLVTVPRNPLL
ncbi:hypothetical protein DNTS_031478 [Danionella cerebrum]|uniref:Uncharacterized protein n=1 Tax=Danionella cerebrum TaxID=2873325 RepID=A0A553PEP7_9TELE|nr:hypothetical protein DNTS_031478 [Danionella translucida]